uniref:Uncharacterized protein LOC105127434 n=1 Tax=Rhizophora mucronata TaxID=61149 RepID=A0A2P2JRT9_RHIMU
MWRSIDAQMKLLLPLRTIIFTQPSPCYLQLLKLSSGRFSPSKTLSLPSISIPFSCILTSSSRQKSRSHLVATSCISSFSSLAPQRQQQHVTAEWTEPVSCSEVGDDGGSVVEEDSSRPSISVRAFFFSTSVDLKSLVEQNKHNFIPPTSRMTNYVVLKFGNLSEPCVSSFML